MVYLFENLQFSLQFSEFLQLKDWVINIIVIIAQEIYFNQPNYEFEDVIDAFKAQFQ